MRVMIGITLLLLTTGCFNRPNVVTFTNPVTRAKVQCVAPRDDQVVRQVQGSAAADASVRQVEQIRGTADLTFEQKVERIRAVIQNFQTLEEMDFRMCAAHAQGQINDETYQAWVTDLRAAVQQGMQPERAKDEAALAPSSIDLVVLTEDDVYVRTVAACSDPQLSADCHNKRDGESGCPSRHTFEVVARTSKGKLKSPSIDCLEGACEWNAGSGHFRSVTWDASPDGKKIVGHVPVSSRPTRLRICAKEDVFRSESRETVAKTWTDLKPNQPISFNLPAAADARLIARWPHGERLIRVGQSDPAIRLESSFAQGASMAFNYTVVGLRQQL